MFLILVVFSIFSALLCHSVLKSFLIACITSMLLATLFFWMIAASHFGWLDRVFYKNISIALLVSLGISIVVGGLLKKLKRN
ncbi:MAG: hypothetical protein ACYCZQ_12890 [Burkholderiales bacterium]